MEVFLFAFFAEEYGFLNTLGAYWIPTFLMVFFFPYLLSMARSLASLAPGSTGLHLPRQLHRALILAGFVLVTIPLISTRVLGILLIIPGLRHILLWKFQKQVEKRTNQYFGQWTGPGFRFYYRHQDVEDFQEGYRPMKDVTPRTAGHLDQPSEGENEDSSV